MLTQWLNYILAQVGIGVYVWGAQGQTVAGVGGADQVRAWIYRRYASQSGDAGANNANAAKAWAFFQALSAKIGADKVRFYDCSGLGMYFFQQQQGLSGDLSAAGMYRKCAPIGRADLEPGDWCFKASGGGISHIGYVAADGQVIEARQSGMGVVKRAVSAGGWTLYGRPAWLAEEIEQGASATPAIKRGSAGPAVSFSVSDIPSPHLVTGLKKWPSVCHFWIMFASPPLN